MDRIQRHAKKKERWRMNDISIEVIKKVVSEQNPIVDGKKKDSF